MCLHRLSSAQRARCDTNLRKRKYVIPARGRWKTGVVSMNLPQNIDTYVSAQTLLCFSHLREIEREREREFLHKDMLLHPDPYWSTSKPQGSPGVSLRSFRVPRSMYPVSNLTQIARKANPYALFAWSRFEIRHPVDRVASGLLGIACIFETVESFTRICTAGAGRRRLGKTRLILLAVPRRRARDWSSTASRRRLWSLVSGRDSYLELADDRFGQLRCTTKLLHIRNHASRRAATDLSRARRPVWH